MVRCSHSLVLCVPLLIYPLIQLFMSFLGNKITASLHALPHHDQQNDHDRIKATRTGSSLSATSSWGGAPTANREALGRSPRST